MNNLSEAITQAINSIPEVRALFPSTPTYHYYSKENKDRYFWTTEKCNHKGSKKYVAGIYRYLKTSKRFKLVKRAGFAKKYKAKERAIKWYNEDK